jgi:hypothetical protein
MIFLMILISEQDNIKFYDGIDFDYAKSFSNDGSEGMCVFLIENWISEVKKWKRTQKLNHLLDNIEYDLDYKIDNEFIFVYQTNGELEKIYKIISEKYIKKINIYNKK